MKNYELSCIISSKLSEEGAKELSDKISSLIQSEEGEILETKTPFRQRLGYFIKKEKQGWFSIIHINLEPEKLKSLEKKIKALPEILRFMFVVKKLERKEFLPERTTRRTKAFEITSNREKMAKQPAEEKVELEDIEKKLKEILGEN